MSKLQQPRFLVCLAAYNGMPWIEEQVRTILAQQGVDVRIVFSVDPSSDGTRDWVEALCNRDRRGTLLSAAPPSGGAAQNFFRLLRDIAPRDYDYVALSDQDDLWAEDRLLRAVVALERHQADGYSSSIRALWSDGRAEIIRKNFRQKQWDHLFESPGPGCTFVLNRPLAFALCSARTTGRRDAEAVISDCHDWYIYAFARSKGYRWFIDDYAGVSYRQHSSNVMGANVGWRAARTRWRRLRNGWYRDRILAVAELCAQTETWPVARMRGFTMWDRLLLGLNTFKCRRRFRDCVVLLMALILPRFNRG